MMMRFDTRRMPVQDTLSMSVQCHSLPGRHPPVPRIPYTNRRLGVSCSASKRERGGSSRKGLGILEWTGPLLPQAPLVKAAKFSWKQIWLVFMNELAPQSKDGAYTRPGYAFNGRLGTFEFPVEAGRYVLYLGNPCPWCHRVKMALLLRGLDSMIDCVDLIDDPERASRGGWVCQGRDPYFGCLDLRQIYDACTQPDGFVGRCTAPLLVDVKQKKIVSNESSDIIAMLDDMHVEGMTSDVVLRPQRLVGEIDTFNNRIFDALNNGVYKCGFATSQSAYDSAYTELCATLDQLDERLAHSRFFLGESFTDADLRVFATAARFDAVYSTLFKCTKKWSEYTNLQRWFVDCAHLPLPNKRQLSTTVDIDDCRRSYYTQLFPLNPGGIVPGGPQTYDVVPPMPEEEMARRMQEPLSHHYYVRSHSDSTSAADGSTGA